MKIIKYNELLEKNNLETIINIIKNDGVFVYPTDTLYGIGGNFFSRKVIERIDRIKNRTDMPYSVMISRLTTLEPLVELIPDIFYFYYKDLLPGKYTFLMKASSTIPSELLKESKKIGIRIPNVPNILKLLDYLNLPIITTSVNRSGEPSLNSPEEIIRIFGDSIDFLIDNGTLPVSTGSTILDITENPPRVIRPGDLLS